MHFSYFVPMLAAFASAKPIVGDLVGELLGYQPGYCASSPYSGILPFLSYEPAEEYCTSEYPVPAYTETYTKSHIKTHYKTYYQTEYKTAYRTKTVYKHDKRGHNTKAEEWKTWSKGYEGSWPSACSCIQDTTTVSTTTETTITTTSTSTIPTETVTTLISTVTV